MVIARVMPRVALGTAGSSGSPEAEDAVAMAAFTTLSHELISASSLAWNRYSFPSCKLLGKRENSGQS